MTGSSSAPSSAHPGFANPARLARQTLLSTPRLPSGPTAPPGLPPPEPTDSPVLAAGHRGHTDANCGNLDGVPSFASQESPRESIFLKKNANAFGFSNRVRHL